MNPGEFIAKWRASELKERSAAQEHFIDLCRLLGEPTPAEADPAGEYYSFLERLRRFTVLDPACGSGNFLYLALHALKDIEHRVQLADPEQGGGIRE